MRGIWILITVFLGSLLALSSIAPAFAGWTVFASPNEPSGIAAAPSKLLVTHPYDSNPREILAIDSSGAVTLFATLPNRPAGELPSEEYIDISPGLGGFPASFVYVVQGQNIMRVSPDGLTVTLFATIPTLPFSHSGITFDHVGTFGFDMIITAGYSPSIGDAATGEVWRVNSAGVATLVATVPGLPILEGPEVAPLGFAPFGGQIIVASENFGGGTVFAVSAAGVVSTVATCATASQVCGAEDVRFIPANPCDFGTSGGTYFDIIYPTSVIKFPKTDFTGLGGRALVSSEFSGTIALLTSAGGSVTVTDFAPSQDPTPVGQQEGAAIVDCAVTGAFGAPTVGGAVYSVDSVALLSPWIAVIGLVGSIATVAVFVKRRRA